MIILKYIFAILVTMPILFLGIYLLRRYSQEVKKKTARNGDVRRKSGKR